MSKELKDRYESACNEYAKKFAKKHNISFDSWILEDVGGIAWFDQYYAVSMDVIRQNIDNKHGLGTFFNWYTVLENGSQINYRSYVKGAPITFKAKIE